MCLDFPSWAIRCREEQSLKGIIEPLQLLPVKSTMKWWGFRELASSDMATEEKNKINKSSTGPLASPYLSNKRALRLNHREAVSSIILEG